jgi:hypothetical protein
MRKIMPGGLVSPVERLSDIRARDGRRAGERVRRRPRLAWLILALAAGLAFFGLLLSQVEATRGDSFGQLVVAQSILKNGTIELDSYSAFFRKPDGSYDSDIQPRGGHLYHYFPIGVPVVALPAVALANLAGLDMRDYDGVMQRVLGAAVGAGIVLLLAVIAGLYFRPAIAAGVAVLALFGTVIGPTVGMALSSNGFEVLFVGIAVLLLLLRSHGHRVAGLGLILGVDLFLAYLCRPTAVAAIVPIFAYLFFTDRKTLLVTALTSAALFGLFVCWSYSEYGLFVPPYYEAGRLGLAHIGDALWGSFFGPSRNLLIFNPFLVAFAILAWWARRLPRQALLLPATLMAMAAGFFAINMASPDWTGFWSYGPRLSSTMVFVALLCSLCLVGEMSARKLAGKGRLALLAGALGLGLVIDLPGLYDPYTWYWNAFPNITQHPDAIALDWRFPQFMATRAMLVEKNLVQSRELGVATQVVPLRGDLLMAGEGAQASSGDFSWVANRSAVLALREFGFGFRTVTILVNGVPIAKEAVGTGSGSFSLDIPAAAFAGREDTSQIEFVGRGAGGEPAFLILGFSLRSPEPSPPT